MSSPQEILPKACQSHVEIGSESLSRPHEDEMCPPGYCIVGPYQRKDRSGKVVPVHRHLRRLVGIEAQRLYAENLEYLYWHSGQTFPPLRPIKGFERTEGANDYDGPIQFWLDYWRSKGLPYPEGLEPLVIKAQIAVESSFRADKSSKTGAAGLMQLTRTTIRALGGAKGPDGVPEVRRDQVVMRRGQASESVVNIAGGIRWLSQKYIEIPRGHPKNIENMLRNYNDWPVGESYAKKVLKLYLDSR